MGLSLVRLAARCATPRPALCTTPRTPDALVDIATTRRAYLPLDIRIMAEAVTTTTPTPAPAAETSDKAETPAAQDKAAGGSGSGKSSRNRTRKKNRNKFRDQKVIAAMAVAQSE